MDNQYFTHEHINQAEGAKVTQKLQQQRTMLLNQRSVRDDTDKALADFLMPDRGEWFASATERNHDKYRFIIDPEAVDCILLAASGMHIGLTNRARQWFKLKINNLQLMKFGPVKTWIESVEKLIGEKLDESGFYQNVHITYQDEMTFGNSCLVVSPDFKKLLTWDVWPIGSYVVQANDRKEIDTIFRDLWMTARNMIEQFGYDNCSTTVQGVAKTNPHQYFKVTQAIVPSNLTKQDSINSWLDMPWYSYYYEGLGTASSGDIVSGSNTGPGYQLLSAKGFKYFPAILTRWFQSGNNVYGSGPGHLWLNKAKNLQQFAQGQIKAIHNELNPAMLVPEAMRQKEFSMLPGAKNFFSGDVGQIKRMFDTRFDYQGVTMLIEDARRQLSKGLFADFMAFFINRDDTPITATEANAIKDEKLLMLGPIIDRQMNEKLDKVIDIVYAEIEDRGELPPVPPELHNVPIKVEYISILAQAQKLINTRSIQAIAGFTGQLAQFDPSALDKFNSDEAIESYGDAVGVPATIIRGKEEVDAIRAARAKMQQMKMQQEALNQQVDNVQKLGTTPLDPETALGRIEQQYGDQAA